MRYVDKRSCCQFLCHNNNNKINLRKSFIILSFILFSRRKTKLLAKEETLYALHSVHHNSSSGRSVTYQLEIATCTVNKRQQLIDSEVFRSLT